MNEKIKIYSKAILTPLIVGGIVRINYIKIHRLQSIKSTAIITTKYCISHSLDNFIYFNGNFIWHTGR